MLGTNVRLQIEPCEGEKYNVKISLKTGIAFEREFKTTVAGAFAEAPSVEHIAWLAWTATRDSGRVVSLFDEWIANDVVDITVHTDEPDPLASSTAPISSVG